MLRKIIILLVAILGIMFVLQIIIVNKQNPQITNEPTWDSQQTKGTFMKVCGDCHSNETKWPWYSNIPPFSFLIYNDVVEGRKEFNVSEFNQNDGTKAAYEYQTGEMPLRIYTVTHGDAILEGKLKEDFRIGLEKTFGKYSKEKFEKNIYNHPEE